MKTLNFDSRKAIPLMAICLWALFTALAVAQESRIFESDLQTAAPFFARQTRIHSVTMWTEDGTSGVIDIAEQSVIVSDYRFDSVVCTPTLVDADGNPITLVSLQEGQWIRVRGFKLNGKIVAEQIQLLSGGQSDKSGYPQLKKLQPIH